MQLVRWFGIVLVAWLAFGGVRRAQACGVWHMTDHSKHATVRWLINSGSVESEQGRRLAALYLDDDARAGLRVVRNRKIVYDVKNGAVRKYGRRVGAIADDGTITFGKHTYTVELTDEKTLHDMPAWKLTVRRGDDIVLESDDASALCAMAASIQKGTPLSTPAQQAEIRRRVAFYLAWRELGM
jgi:hypothetical protein